MASAIASASAIATETQLFVSNLQLSFLPCFSHTFLLVLLQLGLMEYFARLPCWKVTIKLIHMQCIQGFLTFVKIFFLCVVFWRMKNRGFQGGNFRWMRAFHVVSIITKFSVSVCYILWERYFNPKVHNNKKSIRMLLYWNCDVINVITLSWKAFACLYKLLWISFNNYA